MRVALSRAIPAGTYPLMVGLMAVAVTVSMTIPFASILIGAVLLRRDLWKELVVISSLGSATGGLILYFIFHYLGWNQIADAYPDLADSKAWADATGWISDYGTWTLLGIAALPIPKTPALIFIAMSRLPASEVFLALFLGMLLIYGFYGWLAAECPSCVQRVAPMLRTPFSWRVKRQTIRAGTIRRPRP